MWDELRYRWRLRKYLKNHTLTKRVHAETKDYTRQEGEPDIRRTQEKERTIQENEIAVFRSNYLVEQAYLYHVPVPEDGSAWLHSRFVGQKYLTADAAMKLRSQIRAEQKANMEYWQTRVTLVLAIIGCIFGILAYFRK